MRKPVRVSLGLEAPGKISLGVEREVFPSVLAFSTCSFLARDGNAEKRVEFELYAAKERKGMAAVSFEARKRLRYIRPAEEKEECPDGKLLKPSFMMDLSVFRHIAAVTRFPTSPSAYFETFIRSGSQRESRSGYATVNKYNSGFGEVIHTLGLPKRFFMPSVIKNAEARDSPSPSHP